MILAKRVAIVLAVLAVAVPASVGAGIFANCGICGLNFGFGISCNCRPCMGCHMPPPACACPAPAPMLPAPVSMRPIVQTQYRQEQFVTYRDVPRTQVRREAFVEQVPVTVMMSQTRYRDVAFQVTERVAEAHTRMVPVQHVNYVPSCSRPVSVGCSGAGPILGTSYAPPPASPAFAGAIPQAVPTAVTPISPSASLPTLPPIIISPYGQGPAVPAYPDIPATDNWETIRPRTPSRPTSGSSLFRPAPSAATVWQSSF